MIQGPTQLPAFINSDATFRQFVQGIRDALTALGFARTTDTGQLDPATVTTPAGINTAAGYEVYRFADPLQATLPIFFKVEYGTGGTVDKPGLWVTAGTATNGAGTITAQASARKQVAAGTSKTAGATLAL